MKNFKKTLCGLLFGLAGFGAVAATVSDVTARQRYPWNGKIDIDYTITGMDTAYTALALTLTDHDTGRVYTLTEAGRHQLTWSKEDLVVSNATVATTLVSYSTPVVTEGHYCVIDLSEGPDATQWPVSYFSGVVPADGWTDEYKTTKLVLRRIEAGSFIMGYNQSDESHRVTLTRPFYMGVFEVTQRQWELVMGTWPSSSPSSSYGCGDAYPAYGVSYNDIRGSSLGAKWPASSAVDVSSFLGRLRAKTELDFDLPTEAQWEYACRAGTTTAVYWDSGYGYRHDGDYAWYYGNSDSKSHPVGTRLPNAWGLYDIIGNVMEWCLDWDGTLTYGTDPVGSASSSLPSLPGRARRGGSRSGDAFDNDCTSYKRVGGVPSYRYYNSGFRLSWTLP